MRKGGDGQRPRTLLTQYPAPRRPQPHGRQRSHEARPDRPLLIRVGGHPLIVKKLRYYADKEFAGMFDDG